MTDSPRATGHPPSLAANDSGRAGGDKRWIWAILILAAILRLVHIDAAPVGHHGWRQADTAAVARNFHEHGYRLFYPQIDWAVPGYVEMEFPLYPWVVALAYGAFGEEIALARLLAAAASVTTVFLIFLLVKRTFCESEALWAAAMWAVLPLSVYFGRATMPESWMLAFSVAGVLQFMRWLEDPGPARLLTAAGAIALACLLKPTALFLGLPMLWLAHERHGYRLLRTWQLWLVALMVLLPVAAWYIHAYHIGSVHGASFGVLTGPASKVGQWELLLNPNFYRRLFLDFVAARILTWPAVPLFLVGLLLPRRHRRERLFDFWLLGAVLALLVGSGASFVHEYYSLPLLVPAVAFMGRAFVWVRARSRPLLFLFVAGIIAASLTRWNGYLQMERPNTPKSEKADMDRRAAEILAASTAPDALIISCDNTDPTWLYLARRKGFGKDCDAMDKAAISALEESGALYLIARHAGLDSQSGKRLLRHLRQTRKILHDDDRLVLVELSQPDAMPASWRQLHADDFEDGRLPDWRFERGTWTENDGALWGVPAGRRLRASLDPVGCTLCGLAISFTPSLASSPDRRTTAELIVRRDEDSVVELTLDYSARRIRLEEKLAGATVGRSSTAWPLVPGREVGLGLWFDGYDLRVLVDSQLVLTRSAPSGGLFLEELIIAGQNVRVVIDNLAILGPAEERRREAPASERTRSGVPRPTALP